MENELTQRVQKNLNELENLKVLKIETETKIKQHKEIINSCLEKAKELGYNSLEELEEAKNTLEPQILAECERLETAFSKLENA